MSIRKIKGLESDFTIVPNKAINDKLSWAARGMLLYLCSKPDDWDVCITDLVKQTTGSSKRSGRDAVRSIMKELIECGYMRKTQNNIKGVFQNADHEVSFLPFTENPYTVHPSTDKSTQESKDLTKERLNKVNINTDISLVPKENGYFIDSLDKKSFIHCNEAMRIINHFASEYGDKIYTGSLTESEWSECEYAMRSVDSFEHYQYISWWMSTRAKGFKKMPSLPNMLCDVNGISFDQLYETVFMQECD